MTEPTHLFTVTLDYFATGEGRHMLARISYAADEANAKEQFAKEFGDWYALGCTVEPGIVANAITRFLFSQRALQDARELVKTYGEGACPQMKASFEFNLS